MKEVYINDRLNLLVNSQEMTSAFLIEESYKYRSWYILECYVGEDKFYKILR